MPSVSSSTPPTALLARPAPNARPAANQPLDVAGLVLAMIVCTFLGERILLARILVPNGCRRGTEQRNRLTLSTTSPCRLGSFFLM